MTNKPKIVAVSVAGLMMIAGFEGLRTTTYRDVVGVPTICYGHTKNVSMGVTKTKEQCWKLLKEAVQYFEKGLVKAIPYTVAL